MIRNVGIVSDTFCFSRRLVLIRFLKSTGWNPIDLGVNTDTESFEYEELGRRVINGIANGLFLCAVGLSASGNGIQIYVNKSDIGRAAPLWNERDVDEAVKILGCNVCDIYSQIPEEKTLLIAQSFLLKFEELTNERLTA